MILLDLAGLGVTRGEGRILSDAVRWIWRADARLPCGYIEAGHLVGVGDGAIQRVAVRKGRSWRGAGHSTCRLARVLGDPVASRLRWPAAWIRSDAPRDVSHGHQ